MAKEPAVSGVHPDDAPEYQEFLGNIAGQVDNWCALDPQTRESTQEFTARLIGQVRTFVRRTGRY